MAEAAMEVQRWTREQFLDWVFDQQEKFELVGGFPVRMMAGAKKRHNIIAGNVNRSLGAALADSPCIPFQSDMAVATAPDKIRFPDVVVDCSNEDEGATHAEAPVLIVEVLSEGTKLFDVTDKLEEYKRVDTIRHVMIVETAHLAVELHSRDEDGWSRARFEEADDVVPLPTLGFGLPLAEIYARTDAQPRALRMAPPR